MQLERILVPVDFTPITEPEVRHAVQLAGRFGARLYLEHNLDPRPPGFLTNSWMWSEEHERQARERGARSEERLRHLLGRLPAAHRGEGVLTRGPVDLSLLQVARGLPADLILMGSHGPSNLRHHSTTESVLLEAPCPVLAFGEVRTCPELFDRMACEGSTILVALRGDADAGTASRAFALARKLEAKVVLMAVARGRGGIVPHPPDPARLARLVPDDLIGRVEPLVRQGSPVEEILQTAAERSVCLLVLGSRRSRGMRRRPGPVARAALHRSPCPVWFLPHDGAAARPGLAA